MWVLTWQNQYHLIGWFYFVCCSRFVVVVAVVVVVVVALIICSWSGHLKKE